MSGGGIKQRMNKPLNCIVIRMVVHHFMFQVSRSHYGITLGGSNHQLNRTYSSALKGLKRDEFILL